MKMVFLLMVGFIALQHLVIMSIEMFAWDTIGKRIFLSLPRSLFRPTRVLAANQGIYNGVLAAGLCWTLFIEDSLWQAYISLFFLSSIVVVALFGAATVSMRILLVQGIPALVALLLLWIGLE